MLNGIDAAKTQMGSEGVAGGMPKEAVAKSLTYVRDRVGVPRDMTVHGARQFRSHINWFLEELQ
jgi:hypothetical protein